MLVSPYMDPLGETLTSIVYNIRVYYQRTIEATPNQSVFSRDMIFNIASVKDWIFITTKKQRQLDIDNEIIIVKSRMTTQLSI